MQRSEPDWAQLRACVAKWFNDANTRLDQAQAEMTIAQGKVGFVAIYCLNSCQDYLDSAFDAFEKGRPYAGSACVRPVAETAITFLWCVPSEVDHQERIERWIKTTLKEEEKFLDALGKTWVFRQGDQDLTDRLDAVRRQLGGLKHRKELPKLKQMLESIDKRLTENIKASDMYPMLYQYLCSSSHAPLSPERYFCVKGDMFKRTAPITMPGIVPWVLLTSAYWLIFAVCGYFGWDFAQVKAEYAEAVRSCKA